MNPIRAVLSCLLVSTLLLAACGSSSNDVVESAENAEAATVAPASEDDTDDETNDQSQADASADDGAAELSDADDDDHEHDENGDHADEDDDHDDDHGDDHEHDEDGDHVDDDDEEKEPQDDASAASVTGVDVSLFFDGALVNDPTLVPCTLGGGAETMCYQLTVSGYPSSYEVGPFCPTTITDDGGLWWDGDSLYELDGDFITSLAEIYGDDNWRMYDEDGNVFVTETAEEFDLAARPNVDESLQNHCVEGRLEWLDNGEPVQSTVLIPAEPVAADRSAAPQGNQGVTLDGVVIANSAPVDAILGAYTIAAFDDCGAHFNPFDGYHLHGAVGCSELAATADGDTPMFGYAMDGYPIHSPLEDGQASDLDECNGHFTEEAGYHYHANSAEENQVVECLVGQTATSTDTGGDAGERPEGDAGGRPEEDAAGRPGGPPDFTEAAAALGVSAAELEAALGRPPFDLDAAAAALGVSAEDLEAVLPAP